MLLLSPQFQLPVLPQQLRLHSKAKETPDNVGGKRQGRYMLFISEEEKEGVNVKDRLTGLNYIHFLYALLCLERISVNAEQ